jgi:magnesium-transporting ATPase (P-type)
LASIYTNGQLSDSDQIGNESASSQLFRIGVLCNDAVVTRCGGSWHSSGEPLEVALIDAATRSSLDVTQLRADVSVNRVHGFGRVMLQNCGSTVL